MTTITITGVDQVLRKLKKTGEIGTLLGPPMRQSMMHLQRRAARYPQKQAGAFSRLATPGQRRAYWARVRTGIIKHGPGGYVRTGTLGRKWTYRVHSGKTFIRGELGNNAGYGIYTQGSRRQPFHAASKWQTTDEIAENETGTIQGYFDAAIKRGLA